MRRAERAAQHRTVGVGVGEGEGVGVGAVGVGAVGVGVGVGVGCVPNAVGGRGGNGVPANDQ